MNIGDDWFTKTMLVNTLSRNVKMQSQMGADSSEFSNLFAEVLNELFSQTEPQIAGSSNMASHTPNMAMKNLLWNTNSPNIVTQEMPLNGKEPLNFQTVMPEKLNQVLDGKLKGMGEAFIQAGQRYNINPALLAAIAQHESGNGKSQAAFVKNNIAGMMGYNGLKSYSTVEDSINDMARNLSRNYLGNGLSSISKIGAKYAPIGATNDPSGLNNHWVTGVTHYFEKLIV